MFWQTKQLFVSAFAWFKGLVCTSVSNFGSDQKCRENRIFWSEIGKGLEKQAPHSAQTVRNLAPQNMKEPM